jgi:heat-inducible transcriptional repressor
MSLDARKKQILKAVVDDYIETVEPVGSKTLVQKYGLDISSATVRNEMAELESMGYLEQPHTSAGRIPSDKGYREYVDSLMDVGPLSRDDIEQFRENIRDGVDEITLLLKRAAGVLTEKTGYTSVALTPRLNESHFRQLKMMMIEPGRVLVVVVLNAGLVKDRIARIPELIGEEQLHRIAQAIESELSGMRLDDITMVTVSTAGHRIDLPESLLNQVLYEAYVSIKQAENLELYMDGHNKLLSFPEFQDVRKAKTLFDTLARDGIVAGFLNESPEWTQVHELSSEQSALSESADGRDKNARIEMPRRPFMIRIGQEIALEGLQECSFVTTTYRLGDRIIGRIGVMGPKRMEYGRVVSNIGFIRSAINEFGTRMVHGEDKEKTEDIEK